MRRIGASVIERVTQACVCASMLLAMWRQYVDGRIATADLWMGVRQVSMVASIILIVLTVA